MCDTGFRDTELLQEPYSLRAGCLGQWRRRQPTDRSSLIVSRSEVHETVEHGLKHHASKWFGFPVLQVRNVRLNSQRVGLVHATTDREGKQDVGH